MRHLSVVLVVESAYAVTISILGKVLRGSVVHGFEPGRNQIATAYEPSCALR